MKRIGNIYNNILDIKKIDYIYQKRIKLNIKTKRKLERFEENYVSNIYKIKEKLENKTYIPCKYNIFLIKEPKLRLIMSQNIEDKIINHLVSEFIIKPYFDNTFIYSNVSTRVNKGMKLGINLVKKYINILKDKEFYILKIDISKYFYNIDHNVLKELIRRKIKDKDVIELIDKIIDSTNKEYINKKIKYLKDREINKILNSNNKNKDKLIKEVNSIPYCSFKSVPIGNMSSQLFSLIMLSGVDHFIKEKLRIKYVIRYCDDYLLLHTSKDYLKYCLDRIKDELDKLNLKINNKTNIYKSSNGFNFIGFRYIIKNNKLIIRVSIQTKRRIKRRININNISSYKGYLKYCSSNKMLPKREKKDILSCHFVNILL